MNSHISFSGYAHSTQLLPLLAGMCVSTLLSEHRSYWSITALICYFVGCCVNIINMNSSFKEQKPHNNTKKLIEATVNTTTVPMNFGCVGRAIFSFMYWWILVVSHQKMMPYSKEKWWKCSSYHIHLNWWTLYWCVSINTNDNFSALHIFQEMVLIVNMGPEECQRKCGLRLKSLQWCSISETTSVKENWPPKLNAVTARWYKTRCCHKEQCKISETLCETKE